MKRVLIALAVLLGAAPAAAHGGAAALFDAAPYADHWFLPVGLSAQLLASSETTFLDEGLEISVHHFPPASGRTDSLWGFGAYTQLQVGGLDLQHEERDPHLRWALGGQATWSLLGCQLGMAQRAFVQDHAHAFDVTGAVFVSIGILSAGFHAEAPVIHVGDGTRQVPAFGGMLTLKYPFDLGRGR